jgi:uncharacterized cupin superfamily protein
LKTTIENLSDLPMLPGSVRLSCKVMELVTVYHLDEVAVAHEPVHPDEIVADQPTTGAVTVTTLDGLGVEVGVWEMSTGAVRDVEAEEAFLVLAGRATIETGGETFEVARGDLVRLAAGTRTVWTVTEPLRKLYVTGV